MLSLFCVIMTNVHVGSNQLKNNHLYVFHFTLKGRYNFGNYQIPQKLGTPIANDIFICCFYEIFIENKS